MKILVITIALLALSLYNITAYSGDVTGLTTYTSGDTLTAADLNNDNNQVKTAVDGNAFDIGTNAFNIGKNASDVSTNAAGIATNKSGIATNKSGIATNKSDISTNAADISSNATGISDNAFDIGTNTINIGTNTSDIATNAADISTNAAGIVTNASGIANNAADISSNTANFEAQEKKMIRLAMGIDGLFINANLTYLAANGWSVCYSELYSEIGTAISAILAVCNKARLMLACRTTGSATILVGASAPRADVTFDTGNDPTTTHYSNGVEWYYNPDKSWGFALAGDSVSKYSCDTRDENGLYRMCIHTTSGATKGGYRCGIFENLNSSAAYERIWLHKD